MSFPMAGFVESDATGSTKPKSASLWPDLEREDWRRANAALAVALDPQGNGASVAWENPQSGAKGSFVAQAPPFTERDRVCRAFKATLSAKPKGERGAAGSACRNDDGEWVLRDVRETRVAKG